VALAIQRSRTLFDQLKYFSSKRVELRRALSGRIEVAPALGGRSTPVTFCAAVGDAPF
jgi:hypothetical protein